MKRTRKRILSLFMAGAMLLCQAQLPATVFAAGKAAGMEYPLNGLDPDKAATKPTLSLTQETITLVEANANPTRKIVLSVSGADKKYARTGLHIEFDSRLTLMKDSATPSEDNYRLSRDVMDDGYHGCFVMSSASTDVGRDGALWEFQVKLPSDVKEGDEFPVEIVYKPTQAVQDMFTNADQDTEGSLMEAYVFTKGIEQGYIRIADGNNWHVQFDANGGSGKMVSEAVEKGTEYTLPDCLFTPPSGKVFTGWKVSGAVKQPGDRITVTTDLTASAQWGDPEANVKVTFNANGGTGKMSPVTIRKNSIYNLPQCTFTPPEGKQFAGWKLGETAKVLQPNKNVQVTRDMELIAQWDTAVCQFDFDANGGTGTMESVKAEYGSKYTLPECKFTAPAGMHFAGWKVNGEMHPSGDQIPVLGDLSILAVWETKTSGACGDNMAWEYNTETNTLTLEGEGMMNNFMVTTDSDGNDVYDVPWYAFRKDIEYVILPEGLTTVGDYAFADCGKLKAAEIPEKVTYIGTCAFDYCDTLTEVTLPESVAEVGKNAFANTAALEQVIILNPAAKISDYNDVTLGSPEKITVAGFAGSTAQKYAEKNKIRFAALDKGTCGANLTWSYDSKKKTLTVSGKGDMTEYATAEEVPWHLVQNQIASVSLPEGLTSVSASAFYRVSPVKEITLPAGLKRIGDYAFYGSSLESVTIPEGVTYIGKYAFADTQLSEVTVPETAEQIGTAAFRGCVNLQEILILNPKTVIADKPETVSNGVKQNGFDSLGIPVYEPYFDGTVRGEADSTAAGYAKTYGYHFEALRHKIHFTANGGSGEMKDVTPSYGKPYKLPACTFTAPAKGMQCSKWLVGGELKAVGETVIVTDEVEAMPLWEYAVCKVTFAANGGKGTQAEMQAISGLAFSLPACSFTAPKDKAFCGWQLGDKTYQPGETVTLKADTEIKAVWDAPKKTVRLGDVNSDGKVDTQDAMLLTRWLNDWTGLTVDTDAADLDRDGEVTVADAMILTRYANNWEGYDAYIKDAEV